MANKTINDLTAASSAAATDLLETEQSGNSRKLTLAQVLAYIQGTTNLGAAAVPLARKLSDSTLFLWSVSSSTAPTIIGSPSQAVVGTASRPTPDSSAWPSSSPLRLRLTSSTTASASASWRAGEVIMWRGNAAGRGGFGFSVAFGMSAVPASVSNAFMGVSATTGNIAAGTQPSALTNIIGMGFDRTQTTWRIFHNDGSGTATGVDLGANFPVNATSLYRLTVYAPANAGDVLYYVENLGTGNTASGTLSTDLPSSTTFLGYQFYTSMNSGSTAVALDILYAEGRHEL